MANDRRKMNNLWYIHMTEYNTAVRKEEIMQPVTICRELENMLSKMIQKKKEKISDDLIHFWNIELEIRTQLQAMRNLCHWNTEQLSNRAVWWCRILTRRDVGTVVEDPGHFVGDEV